MKKKLFEGEKRRYRSVGAWARKGSATMEYVILIAVGALFASLLYLAMSDGEGLIQSAMEKRVQETIQGQLPEGDMPSGNNLGLGDPRDIGRNPEMSGSPDAGIPPERSGSSDRSGTALDGPDANGTSPSTSGGGSRSPTSGGNASASPSHEKSEEGGGFLGWLNKAKNYVVSGQILKDAAHVGKETLDFLILDDVSGCVTGKDTDGNRVSGWERGLSCVSLIPVAKVAKLGKFADEAIAFAGKLDDKLANTRLGEGMQTAKRKLENLFGRGKQTACGCPDAVGKKVEKDRSLDPGTPEHKQNRWEVYKANGGEMDYDHWSKLYDANVKNQKVSKSHEAVEKLRQKLGWGKVQVSVQTPHGRRILDIADEDLRKGIEHKTSTKADGSEGYFYLDDRIREEIKKDKYLIEEQDWDITWYFEKAKASEPLLRELKKAGIKVNFE